MYKDIAATSDGTMFYDMWQLIIVLVRKCKGSMCIFMLVEGECVMFACRNVLPCTTLKGHSFELIQHPFHSSVQLSTHLQVERYTLVSLLINGWVGDEGGGVHAWVKGI